MKNIYHDNITDPPTLAPHFIISSASAHCILVIYFPNQTLEFKKIRMAKNNLTVQFMLDMVLLLRKLLTSGFTCTRYEVTHLFLIKLEWLQFKRNEYITYIPTLKKNIITTIKLHFGVSNHILNFCVITKITMKPSEEINLSCPMLFSFPIAFSSICHWKHTLNPCHHYYSSTWVRDRNVDI